MREKLQNLTGADVKRTLKKIEPQESYVDSIASKLEETVYGQPEACRAVARRLALFESGLSDPNRPLGSIVELGPTGVGKTEMAHAAAKYLFDDPNSDRLKIINMAEMTEGHYITRFVGSPPSYVGYSEKPLIPHDWLHKGRSIVVLDEFEKAHPEIRQLFLGVLDKRSMDARKGLEGVQKLDFGMCLLIFTANIAGGEISKITNDEGKIGFGNKQKSEQEKEKLISGAAERGLKEALSPEFLNRIDDIIIFKEIKDRSIHDRMITKFINEKNEYLKDSIGEEAPYFAATREFRDHILDTVGNKGGRALKRQLERELFSKAADVFIGLDILKKPLVAHYEEETGVEFWTTIEEEQEAKPIEPAGDVYNSPVSIELLPFNPPINP